MRLVCVYFVTVFAIINNVHTARVLGLFPHTGRSHQMVFEPLLRTLAERGHHVTVASFFPLKNPPANYTDVSFEGIAGIGIETIDLAWFDDPGLLFKIPILGRLIKSMFEFYPLDSMALEVCSKAVDWPPLIQALKKEYDVVLLENFNSDCMVGLLHVYKIRAPVVALLSSSLMPWSAGRVSVMDNPSFVPCLTRAFAAPMAFWERMENTAFTMYYKYWFEHTIQIKEQAIIEKRYGKIPELGQLVNNVSLVLVNTHHSLNGRKILPPGIVEVGGMHLDHTRKVIPENDSSTISNSDDLFHQSPSPYSPSSVPVPEFSPTLTSSTSSPQERGVSGIKKPTSLKRKKENLIELATKHLSADADHLSDENITGLKIGSQLKKMTNEQRLLAEKFISEIMYYGQVNKLYEGCYQFIPNTITAIPSTPRFHHNYFPSTSSKQDNPLTLHSSSRKIQNDNRNIVILPQETINPASLHVYDDKHYLSKSSRQDNSISIHSSSKKNENHNIVILSQETINPAPPLVHNYSSSKSTDFNSYALMDEYLVFSQKANEE